MSNGYKPAPLDLSDVKLLPPQEILVDKLAENAHNVWAKDRIKQGWTYGIQQVRNAGSGMLAKLEDRTIHPHFALVCVRSEGRGCLCTVSLTRQCVHYLWNHGAGQNL